MKKLISVLLAVLMLFSAVSVVAFADNETVGTYKISFKDYDGSIIKELTVLPNGIVVAPPNPTRESTDEIEYVFEGWSLVRDGVVDSMIYKGATIPVATEDATYIAIYSEHENLDGLTFWSFIASIFARINQIFEYFYNLFTRNLD